MESRSMVVMKYFRAGIETQTQRGLVDQQEERVGRTERAALTYIQHHG